MAELVTEREFDRRVRELREGARDPLAATVRLTEAGLEVALGDGLSVCELSAVEGATTFDCGSVRLVVSRERSLLAVRYPGPSWAVLWEGSTVDPGAGP